jgi:hypothetical protein
VKLKQNDLVKLKHTNGMPQSLANRGFLGVVLDPGEFPLEHAELIKKVGTHEAEQFVAVKWIRGWGEENVKYPADGFYLAARFELQKRMGDA